MSYGSEGIGLGFEAHGGRACPGGRPKAKALGYEPLVSRWPVMPGLKSGPISEAKATTGESALCGCGGAVSRG